MGYHQRHIDKGILGNVSKIKEELLELEDAATQGIKIMALLELSDIYGAMEFYLERNYQGFTMDDLAKMSAATKSAFKDGTRK